MKQKTGSSKLIIDSKRKVTCPQCEGKGWYDDQHTSHSCPYCDKDGKMTKKVADAYSKQQKAIENYFYAHPSSGRLYERNGEV